MTALQHALKQIALACDLTAPEMKAALSVVMNGDGTQAQVGAFLMGLRVKGESVDEIVAAAEVLRELSLPVAVSDRRHLVDTCGTGGDGASTFNISTASAIVCACAGAKVAKHGNRSVSSRSGSADVLEAAGVNLSLSAEQVGRCIDEVGVGFLFAPRHHEAMRHASGPRKELGVRTLFNLLGPLTNPARAPRQLIGVFADALLVPFAQALKALGSEHVLVVHSDDGLDEISPGAPTEVCELKAGGITRYRLSPTDFGLRALAAADLKVANAEESLAVMMAVFAGSEGAAATAVALNAGAALYVAGLATGIAEGVVQAQGVLRDGRATTKLQELVAFTQACA
ncbi:MAG TPA: anthranilate phosphoribosyltransferase [Acidiferrobacter sp.]|nr:anthranilate phosphoribosyltransferase [Acidiferrobacter sp.]